MPDEPLTDRAADPEPVAASAVNPGDSAFPTNGDDEATPPSGLVDTFFAFGPVAWLAMAWAVTPLLGSLVLFRFVGQISDWLRAHDLAGVAVYVAVFAATAGVGALPTYAQAALGGWAFGPTLGTAAAVGGITAAALIGRAIARPLGRERAERVLAMKPRWRAVRDALLAKRGARVGGVGPGEALRVLGLVCLVRLPFNSPFSLTNLVLTTAGVPLWAYALGTAIGMLPRTFAVAWLGSQIEAAFNADAVDRPWWWLPVMIGSGVAVIAVLAVVTRRALDRLSAESEAETGAETGAEPVVHPDPNEPRP